MNICFQHSGILPVIKYGGTKRIIFWLMKELVKLGHNVTLIGNPNSQVNSIGVQLISQNDENWVSLIPKNIDLIHLFYTPDPKIIFPVPYLITIEGNGKPGEVFHRNTLFISKKHAEMHGSTQFVYNGLDPDEYPYHPKKLSWNNFLFLAKAKWKVKNLKDCVKACKINKKYLHVAGGRALTLSRYIHSYGMVDQQYKNKLIDICDALLFPVKWHEPFGIAIIEAMAKGRPVIGSSYGSLPELIGLKGEGGKICNSFNDLVQILSFPQSPFQSEKVREYFEKNFTSRIMANNYILFYEKISQGHTINSHSPKTVSDIHPEHLLPF